MHCIINLQKQSLQINYFMVIVVTKAVYDWFLSLSIIATKEKNLIQSAQNKNITQKNIQLPATISIQVQSGSFVGKLIKTILRNNKQTVPQVLENIREGSTNQIKMTNWNAIWSSFHALRMQFDNKIKQLILSGDNDMIVEIINQLHQKYSIQNKNIASMMKKQGEVRSNKKSNKHPEEMVHQKFAYNNTPLRFQNIDLNKFNYNKDIKQVDSCPEFALLILSYTLKLYGIELVNLFSNQNKLISELIVYGIDGEFKKISEILQLTQKNVEKLKQIMKLQTKNQFFVVNLLKYGLVSSNQQVTQQTISLFKQLEIYKWMIGDARGFIFYIQGLKIFPNLFKQFAQLLILSTGNNFIQFMTKYFKKNFSHVEEMLYFVSLIVQCFIENDQINQIIRKNEILKQWMDLSFNILQNQQRSKSQTRMECLKFMCKICKTTYIQSSEQNKTRFLNILSKNWKDHSFNQFITFAALIFDLYNNLMIAKHAFAKPVYNAICQILTLTILYENHRNFLILNFIELMKRYPIPINILIESYSSIKSFQVFDMEFLSNILSLASINIKCGMIIGELCLIQFQSNFFNDYILNLIVKIVHRFKRDSLIFVSNMCKSLLSILFALQKNKKLTTFETTGKNIKHQYQQELINAQKRSAIIQLFKKIILINVPEINNKIKPYLIGTNIQLKQFHPDGSKGINSLLSLYAEQNQEDNIQQFKQKKFQTEPSKRENDQEDFKKLEIQSKKSYRRPKVLLKPAPQQVIKHLQNLHEAFIQKKKKAEENIRNKAEEEERKKISIRKQVQKIKFLNGLGSEAILMQDGQWEKNVQKKKKNNISLLEFNCLEENEIFIIQNNLKKYRKVLRQLFFKYTSTGFTTKKDLDFDQLGQRSETISFIEIIKFLKDYKLFFLTDINQIQYLIRDLNIKILKKREIQEFDYNGFQQFIIQFIFVIYVRPHSINLQLDDKLINQKKEFQYHLPSSLVENFFDYLKCIFQQRKENMISFQDQDLSLLNYSQIIVQWNKKLQAQPNLILPQGFKKHTDKTIKFENKFERKHLIDINQSYLDCLQILEEITWAHLKIHLIESKGLITTSTKARPILFSNNIQSKLLQNQQDLSVERSDASKNFIIKTRKQNKILLTPGMQLGLSYLKPEDRSIGAQVALKIENIICKLEENNGTSRNQIYTKKSKRRNTENTQQRKTEDLKERRKQEQKKKEIEQMKKQFFELKQKTQLEKSNKQKLLKVQEMEKEQKKKQQRQKYLSEQKKKLQTKKKEQEEIFLKKKQEQKQKKLSQKQELKKKFITFNEQQIKKFHQNLSQKIKQQQQRKKNEQEEQKRKQLKLKKLKQKINQEDEKIKMATSKINQQIQQIFNSENIQQIFKSNQNLIKSLFDFLLKSTFHSLTEKKINNQIIFETWYFFILTFKITPHILTPKQSILIFNSITRNKPAHKDLLTGLNYKEFCQALLRCSIKQKVIFNKIASKMKNSNIIPRQQIQNILKNKSNTDASESNIIQINKQIKEEDPSKRIIDNYDCSDVDQNTIKGLITYLNLPSDKNELERRFREVLEEKNKKIRIYKQQLQQTDTVSHENIRSSRLKKSISAKNGKEVSEKESNNINISKQSVIQGAEQKE